MAALALAPVLAIAVAGLPAEASPGADAKPATTIFDAQSIDHLNPKILAVMRRQESLQPAVQVLYDAYAKEMTNGFAGLAFEGDGLTLYHKGAPTPAMSRALAAARKAGPVTVKPAAFSKAELEAEGSKIHERVAAHGLSDIQSVGYPYDGSGLKVEKMPQASARAQAQARALAGGQAPAAAETVLAEAGLRVPVEVSVAAAPFQLASRVNDTPAWNGGGRWESWRGLDHRASCTTGFGVNSGGRSWVLTAAHCATPPDIAFQGVFGGGAGTGFTQMGPIGPNHWNHDLLLIDAPGFYLIFDGSPTTSNTKRVYGWGYWAANELVCQSGMKSGVVCGIKQQYSVDATVSCANPDSDGDCGYVIKGLIRGYQIDGATAVRPGDSGGPVFTLLNDGVRAKGIVSGGNAGGNVMYFQDWHDVIRLYNAYPRTS